MIDSEKRGQTLIPVILSLLAHFCLFSIIDYWIRSEWSVDIQKLNRFQPRRLSIKEIKEEKPPPEIRTVGKRDSDKKDFSSPIPISSERKKEEQQQRQKEQKKQDAAFSLRDIGKVDVSNIKRQKRTTNFRAAKTKSERLKQISQREMKLKDLSIGSQAREIRDFTDVGIKFDPPEGVSEDELNTIEKIYYSFQKRSFENYVQSFLLSYRDSKESRPLIINDLRNQSHRMIGKVTFDRGGNIISIKTIRPSQSDDVQDMFQKTLQKLRLPNPPDGLLDSKGQFSIFYQLNLNP